MKKIITILIIFITVFAGNLKSQDTSITKFLPLSVGNVWVYKYLYVSLIQGGVGYDKYKITNTIQVNGKTYYTIQHTTFVISGNASCEPGLFSGNIPIRLDSFSCNIYKNTSCGPSFESLFDSLKSRIGDSAVACSTSVKCTDTALTNIFGVNRQSKNFTISWFEGQNTNRFVKDIGLVQDYTNFMGGSCHIDIQGCVVNGIVYGDTTFGNFNTITGTVRYRDNSQNVTSGYVKAYRHSYQGFMNIIDSAVIQSNGSYTLTHIPSNDTTDLMAFQDDEINGMNFVPTYYVSTIYWQEAESLVLNNDTSGIDISVYRINNNGNSSRIISGNIYGYTTSWLGISDARLYAWNANNYRMYSISNTAGLYSLDSLPIGFYQVICDRINYPTQTRNVYLGRNNRKNINFYFDHLVGVQSEPGLPEHFLLNQNYPNPFNPVTSIKFSLPYFSEVKITVYDILGHEAVVLENGSFTAGVYEVEFDGTNYSSGVYFYKLETDGFIDTKKMVLIK